MSQLEGVPVIDLAAAPKEQVADIATACRDWGFFQVINHGLDTGLSDAALASARQFFEQDSASKRQSSRSLENPWGYYDRELTKNLRDRKEIFDIGQEGVVPWPAFPADFRGSLEHYGEACYRLALSLMEKAASGLALDPALLVAPFSKEHSSFLRLNYYPVEERLLSDEGMPAVGDLGISPHTDAGGLTVLLQDGVSGLQVHHRGDWYDVDIVPGALTINIGDMMRVWSNDDYHAAEHRVRGSEDCERYSIAYFLNPSYDSVIQPLADTPPRYRPFTWQEFRSLRAQGDYGDYGEEVQISQYRLQS